MKHTIPLIEFARALIKNNFSLNEALTYICSIIQPANTPFPPLPGRGEKVETKTIFYYYFFVFPGVLTCIPVYCNIIL